MYPANVAMADNYYIIIMIFKISVWRIKAGEEMYEILPNIKDQIWHN